MKDDRVYVLHMRDALGRIEAAKRMADGAKHLAPDVPWKRIAGMRDKLIHEYLGVNLDIVWQVVQEEVPRLRPQLQDLLSRLEGAGGPA